MSSEGCSVFTSPEDVVLLSSLEIFVVSVPLEGAVTIYLFATLEKPTTAHSIAFRCHQSLSYLDVAAKAVLHYARLCRLCAMPWVA